MTVSARDLGELAFETIRPAFEGVRRVAVLDFPNYANVGDSAIWLGQLELFRRLGVGIDYTCDIDTFDEPTLRARLGGSGSAIVFSGGGSFGDLWDRYQSYRESVIATFADHPVIQLPQSIWFRSDESRGTSRERLERASNLTLFVRDHASLARARDELGLEATLCPDVALCGRLPGRPSVTPSRDALWLCRTDHETAAGRRDMPIPGESIDWAHEPRTRAIALSRELTWRMRDRPGWRRWGRRPLSHLYDGLARARVARGLDLIRSARVLVTDRLHGHILALMTETPHVLMDTEHGKVRDFYDAWTSGSELVHWADSIEEAERTADRARERVG